MELSEVKKYFENAEFVETQTYNEKRKIDLDSIEVDFEGNYFCTEKETGYVFYLGSNKKGFAKILTTKEPSFSITKEQLRQLTGPKVKEWFPEVFEVKLEVGKWYKNKFGLFFITNIKNDIANAYGFESGIWKDSGRFNLYAAKKDVEATNEEVFEALKNEAVNRGFLEGNYECLDAPTLTAGNLENIYHMWNGWLWHGTKSNANCIFKNGKWATIIQTITKQEAEKLLNKKIID